MIYCLIGTNVIVNSYAMPWKARIDAPGALHHIIVRGIERRKIFLDDTDRNSFLNRFGTILKNTSTHCILMGKDKNDWQDAEYILGLFDMTN